MKETLLDTIVNKLDNVTLSDDQPPKLSDELPSSDATAVGEHRRRLYDAAAAVAHALDLLSTDSPTEAVQEQPPVTQANEKDESDEAPWESRSALKRLPLDTPFHTRLEAELFAFSDWISPTDAEKGLRARVVHKLQLIASSIWPDAAVGLFGSVATGLFLPDSDIDLVINSQSLWRSHIAPPLLRSTLSNALISSGFATSSRTIDGARVPIVSFTTCPELGSFDGDISFNTLDGLKGAQIMDRELNRLGPLGRQRVQELIWILKLLLRGKNLMERKNGGLGGLSLFCMVMWHFQLSMKSRRTAQWSSPAQCLMDFFEYYLRHYNHRNWTIDIREGGRIVLKTQLGFVNSTKPKALSIQHPVERGRDVASGCRRSHAVMAAFESSYYLLLRLKNQEDLLPSLIREDKHGILWKLGIRLSEGCAQGRAENWLRWQQGDADLDLEIPSRPDSNSFTMASHSSSTSTSSVSNLSTTPVTLISSPTALARNINPSSYGVLASPSVATQSPTQNDQDTTSISPATANQPPAQRSLHPQAQAQTQLPSQYQNINRVPVIPYPANSYPTQQGVQGQPPSWPGRFDARPQQPPFRQLPPPNSHQPQPQFNPKYQYQIDHSNPSSPYQQLHRTIPQSIPPNPSHWSTQLSQHPYKPLMQNKSNTNGQYDTRQGHFPSPLATAIGQSPSGQAN
ncbi:hypothetical protein T439DRAFT_383140 [Meredithblackwellia eburnea MCA 4105]